MMLSLAMVGCTLLFVFDVSAHGSTFPLTNIAGLEDPAHFPFLRGTLTEFGKRQLFLRGMETRRRLLPSFMNGSRGEIYAKSIDDSAAIMSAQAFLMGLYPPSDPSQTLSVDESSRAFPPFATNPSQTKFATEHGYAAVPVHTDEAELNLAERMRLRGYEAATCPLINETRHYDLQTPEMAALTKELNETIVRWLLQKESELGVVTDVAPPLVTTVAEQTGLVNELLQRRLESRYMPYPQMTPADWNLLEAYRNSQISLLMANDSLAVLGNTALFREIISTFDQRSRDWLAGTVPPFKYQLNVGTPLTLQLFLKGLNHSNYTTQVASSVIVELHAVNGTDNVTSFSITFSVDDIPIELPGCNCELQDQKYMCPFDLTAAFLETRSLPAGQ